MGDIKISWDSNARKAKVAYAVANGAVQVGESFKRLEPSSEPFPNSKTSLHPAVPFGPCTCPAQTRVAE